MTVEARLMQYVIPEPNTGCWLWIGATSPHGYGSFAFNGENRFAHRVMYETKFGKFEKELLVCHKCDTPACVNPAHLFLGTKKDNAVDMVKKGRWVGPSGEKHPQAKLTIPDVHKIRSLHKKRKNTEIAKKFDVHINTINCILAKQTWKGV